MNVIVINVVAIASFQFIANARGMYLSHRGERVHIEVFKCVKYWMIAFLLANFIMDSDIINAANIAGQATVSGQVNVADNKAVHNNAPLAYVSLFSVCWFVSVCCYYAVCRLAVRNLLKFIRVKGFNQRSVVIVGAGEVGKSLAGIIQATPELGLNIKGFYDDNVKEITLTNDETFNVVGALTALIYDAKMMNIDRVYITLSMRHTKKIKR